MRDSCIYSCHPQLLHLFVPSAALAFIRAIRSFRRYGFQKEVAIHLRWPYLKQLVHSLVLMVAAFILDLLSLFVCLIVVVGEQISNMEDLPKVELLDNGEGDIHLRNLSLTAVRAWAGGKSTITNKPT
jgi:hypothetical protein